MYITASFLYLIGYPRENKVRNDWIRYVQFNAHPPHMWILLGFSLFLSYFNSDFFIEQFHHGCMYTLQ